MEKLDFTLIDQIPKSSNFTLLEDIFQDLKILSPSFYRSYGFHPKYEEYIRKLLHNRLKMNVEYICDTTTKTAIPKEEDILNYIVYRHHKAILWMLDDKYTDINHVDLTDACIVSSFKVKDICDELKIPCKVCQIHPGYDHTARLFGLCGFHYFTIITINNKNYLIDCTYKQFFKKANCLLEEIGVPLTCAPSPGIFMQQTETRQRVANKILKDGWIELTEETLKDYCDGFTLSFRNGLYYEQFNDNSFTTSYTYEDYMRFLEGKDNQINHEPIECLGPLKKVLKKPISLK